MVALVGGCIAAAYTQFLMTPSTAPHPDPYFQRNHTDITGGSAVRCQPDSDYTVLITSTPVMEQVI